MPHEHVTNTIREQIALYALGLLEPQAAHEFETHLSTGCAVCEAELRECQAVTTLLPLALPQRTPHTRVRESLLAQIKGTVEQASGLPAEQARMALSLTDLHLVRADQGTWESTGVEGVHFKLLYVDPVQETMTMLVRMAPGATYPRHRHTAPEQCFVLDGDLRAGDLVLRAGDYQCAAPDSIHSLSSTEQGCLLLIVASQHDEVLP